MSLLNISSWEITYKYYKPSVCKLYYNVDQIHRIISNKFKTLNGIILIANDTMQRQIYKP